MFREDDFNYAIENTRVVVHPRQNIETFGTTSFRFYLVSELMDQVNTIRVRDGRLDAERPRIVAPHHLSKLLLDGFGEKAQGYAEWLESQGENIGFLRYGFQFRKTDLSESLVHEPMEAVVAKLGEEIRTRQDPMSALIEGVDEAWEVCLLKFSVEMIRRSAKGNVDEWKRRGLI